MSESIEPPVILTTSSAAANKKPGRPKKNIISDTAIFKGLITTPYLSTNVMELIYSDPKLFKKIINILKGYFVDEVFIEFTKETIYIYAIDNTKNNEIKIELNCHKLNEYYCVKDFEICVKREYLEKVFNTIDKQYNKIIFYSEQDNYNSVLYIIILNEELGINDTYEIDLCLKNNTILSRKYFDVDKDNYKIQFRSNSKSFKKFINDNVFNTKLLIIEKFGLEELKFKLSINNKVNFVRTFLDDKNFSIKSSVEPSELFNIQVKIDAIKPFSNTSLSNFVTIYLDTNKKIIFESKSEDELCTVVIFSSPYYI
jgi:hypothetical protein